MSGCWACPDPDMFSDRNRTSLRRRKAPGRGVTLSERSASPGLGLEPIEGVADFPTRDENPENREDRYRHHNQYQGGPDDSEDLARVCGASVGRIASPILDRPKLLVSQHPRHWTKNGQAHERENPQNENHGGLAALRELAGWLHRGAEDYQRSFLAVDSHSLCVLLDEQLEYFAGLRMPSSLSLRVDEIPID